MKKLTALIVLTLLLISTACSKETNNPSDSTNTTTDSGNTTTTGATTAEPDNYNYPDISLGGATFSILNTDNDYGFYTTLDFESSPDETLDEAVYKRNRIAEDRLDFKLKITEYLRTDTHTHLQTTVQSGDDLYDVAFIYNIHFSPLLDINGVLSLDTIDGFNFDQPWWNSEVTEGARLTSGGELYYAMTDFSLADFEGTVVTYFNKDLFADYGLEAPYDLVKKDNWTLDEMNRLATAANLNGDTDWTEKEEGSSVYGVTTWNSGIDAFIAGSNVDFLKIEDGQLSFGLNTEHFSDVTDKLFTMFDVDGTFALLDPSNGGGHVLHHEKAFMNGRSLMVVAEIKASSTFRDMKNDYGILPMPKYDEQQEDYINLRGFSYVMCIPSTNSEENADISAKVMDLLSYLTYKDVIPAFYNGKLENKQLRDDESIEMLDLIRQTREYDPAIVCEWFSTVRYRVRQIMTSKNNTFSSELATMTDSVNTQLERLNNK